MCFVSRIQCCYYFAIHSIRFVPQHIFVLFNAAVKQGVVVELKIMLATMCVGLCYAIELFIVPLHFDRVEI